MFLMMPFVGYYCYLLGIKSPGLLAEKRRLYSSAEWKVLVFCPGLVVTSAQNETRRRIGRRAGYSTIQRKVWGIFSSF